MDRSTSRQISFGSIDIWMYKCMPTGNAKAYYMFLFSDEAILMDSWILSFHWGYGGLALPPPPPPPLASYVVKLPVLDDNYE